MEPQLRPGLGSSISLLIPHSPISQTHRTDLHTLDSVFCFHFQVLTRNRPLVLLLVLFSLHSWCDSGSEWRISGESWGNSKFLSYSIPDRGELLSLQLYFHSCLWLGLGHPVPGGLDPGHCRQQWRGLKWGERRCS